MDRGEASGKAGETGVLAIAARFAAASATGDLEALRTLYERDAVVWHNHDGIELTVEQSLRQAAWLHRTVPDVRFEDVRHTVAAEGFVQRHVMTGSVPGGGRLHVPACVVITLSVEGRIRRVEEYLDGSHIRPLLPT